jgi:prolyl 4-hydroxylase
MATSSIPGRVFAFKMSPETPLTGARKMPIKQFDSRWRTWLRHNIDRGCSRDELFDILIKEGFEPIEIQHEMKYTAGMSSPPVSSAPLESAAHVGPSKEVLPGLRRHESPLLELYTVDDFLDKKACERLVQLIKARLRPSTISQAGAPDTTFRTSRTCDLDGSNAVVGKLDRDICAAMKISASYAEPTQGQFYEVGQEFKPHTDYFEAYELARFSTARLGQRTWTFMVYLNEPQGGGETAFTSAGFAVKPKTGRAVIWNNLGADGQPNPDTIHQGTPVLAGNKAIITKWFRRPRN